jgi:hypothetical protein
MAKIVNILATHQSPACVEKMLAHWQTQVDPQGLWVAYGGKKEAFDAISWPQKFFLQSPRIRVADVQRDRQGYQEIFQQAVAHGALNGADYVHLAEFDQYPASSQVNDLQLAKLQAEQADVIFYGLERVDHTQHPHYLSHVADPQFTPFLQTISVREDSSIVMTALGFGSFWTADAFRRLAAVQEPFPIYLEIFLPTVAHHLGCRVRPNHQNLAFTLYTGDASPLLPAAQKAGAWFIHPWKTVWNT